MRTERFDDGLVSMEYRPGSYDREVIREVIEFDGYRLRTMHLPPNSTVVDIGGHIGSFAVLTARLFPDARVFTCEMTPDNHAILRRNTAALTNIGVAHAAIIGRRAPSGFMRRRGNSGGHSLVWDRARGLESAGRTATLADVVAETQAARVDLLKLDCEGAEHEIVRLASEDGTLDRVDRIVAEYHEFNGERGSVLAALLSKHGFSVEMTPFDGGGSGMLFALRR